MHIDVIDHHDAGQPARPAATVVLMRDTPDEMEVLLLRRGADTAFGGVWAFPGGTIEELDVGDGTGTDPLPAARTAAVRRTREETGLEVAADTLVWWSHWLPPARDSLSVQRLSTWFFVALAPDGADSGVDRVETPDQRWVAPAVALAMQERRDVELAPPTYVTLTQLVRYGDAASALAAADPRSFATEIHVEGSVRTCLWAGDVGYGGGDPTAAGPRHRLVMDDVDGWCYLDTAGLDAGRVPPSTQR